MHSPSDAIEHLSRSSRNEQKEERQPTTPSKTQHGGAVVI